MSAEVLREAAALMRERAEAALACDPDADKHWWSVDGLRDALDEPGMSDAELTADTDHIASWHPAVALAVAAMLETEAEMAATSGPGWATDEALAVARAYLGADR